MVDATNIKAPGWQRVVAELSAHAPDDKVFLLRLLGVLGQVAGARQGVLYSLGGQRDAGPEVEPRATLLWPLPANALDSHGRMTIPVEQLFDATRIKPGDVQFEQDARNAARSAAGLRQTMVFGLDGQDMMYEGSQGKGFVIAVPIPAGLPEQAGSAPLHGVITLLVENRSRQALQTTLAFVEVLAGYIYGHAAQAGLWRTKGMMQALDLGVRLIASINATSGFKGCTLQLVNDVARQLGMDRVALGWVEGARASRRAPEGRRMVRCVALSDTENLDRRMAMVQKIESAMEESLDQGQSVLYPPPPASGPGADAVLSQAITHAHRELASQDAKLRAASVPLRIVDAEGERLIGVLLLESAGDGKLDIGTVELMQATLDLASPVLAVRYSDDRNLALRTYDSSVKAAAWAVGTKHTVWKVAALAFCVLFLFAAFFRTTYRVGAPMQLLPRERHVISAPFDGVLGTVGEGIEAGRTVTRGQTLATMDTKELLLAAMEAENQITQYEKQAAESLQKQELSEAQQAEAQAEQARARAGLMRSQLQRSEMRSPLSGKIIAGDIRDKVGAAVKLGDPLFELADTSDMLVIARVSDSDIAYIKEGQTGQVSPRSDPSRKVPFTVERIVPLSTAKEGENVFEVRCRLEPNSDLLPGTEGQAKFNTERKSLLWIGTRRVLDQLRVWLWW